MWKTATESTYRSWEIEDTLVRLYGDQGSIGAMAAAAHLAITRLDLAIAAADSANEEVWGWPIRDDERQFVRRVQESYPVDSGTIQQVSSVLDGYSATATPDEVSQAAFSALSWAARRVGFPWLI
jgi:hypothetical protein